MLLSVLASGSKGNSTLIKTEKYNILVDAGMTCKYLEEKLAENNTKLSEINYIVLTHTHIDHTSSLNNLIKKYQPTIIMTDKMFLDLQYLEKYENIQLLIDDLELDGVLIESIKTSHDTSDSRGYIISEKDSSAVVITDTGYLNQKNWEKITNKSVYVFESNHDVEMLMHGRYPKWLKKRVGSTVGHLSNEAAAFYLSRVIGPNTKQIILAHLSDENNTPEIALENIKAVFAEHQIAFDNITAAKQNEVTGVIQI